MNSKRKGKKTTVQSSRQSPPKSSEAKGRRAKTNGQQLAAILERINDGFVAFDAQINYTYVNKRAGELLARAPEDLVGKNYWEEFPEAKGTPFASAYVRALETQEPIIFEDYYAPWDRWFENRIYPSQDGLTIFFTETTERKRAEEKLREQYKFITALTNTNPALVYVYDMDSRSNVYSNDGMKRVLGYTPEEVKTMGADLFPRLVHPDDLTEVIAFQTKIASAKDDEILEIEYRIKDVKGEWHWLHSYERPFERNKDDTLKQKIGIAVDVTERKRAEQLLKTELQVLEKISSDSPLAEILETIVLNLETLSRETIASILLLDADGIHVRYGAAPHLPDGYNRAIEGAPIGPQEGSCGTAMYLHKPIIVTDIESDPFWDSYRELARQHGLGACWSTPVMSSDGTVLASFAMYYREPRSPEEKDFILIERATHMVQIAIERKQMEEKLLESNEKFSKVFYSSPVATSITRMSDGRFVDANEEFLNRLGYSRDEVIGRTALELGLWAEPAEREKMMRIMREQGSLRNFETAFRTKSGETGIGLLSREIVELGGEKHIVGSTLDITELKQAEERVEQQFQRLTTLHAIDVAISNNLDLQVTLDTFLKHATEQLHVDAAAVLLLKPYLNTLEYTAGHGFRELGISQLKLKLGEDYAGQAALERRLVSIPNLKEAERPFSKAHLTDDEGFVSYYGMPLTAKGQVKGVLEVFQRAPFVPSPEWLDFLEILAGRAAIAIDNAQLFEGLQRSNTDLADAYETTIEGWSRALDLRDKETEGHTLRVTETTMRLAHAAGMSDDELVHIKYGTLLHDIGKLGVPDHILFKPDKLTEEEWVVMRKHPTYAYELLSPIEYLRLALDIPYCHHEKWDGTGYPRGLKGEQIPLSARLFAVVDVWDALTNERPYREAWSQERAAQHILEQAGKHFDSKAVELFLQMWRQER